MKKFAAAILLVTMVLVSGQAFAFLTTQPMSVTANVINACTLAVGSMAFGNYTSGAASPAVDATASVNVTCDNGVGYYIDADGGSNYLGPDRRMLNGASNYLNYNVFTDAARTQVWGAAIGGSAINSLIGTGSPQPYTLYGRIWASQTAISGAYSDTITVTVSW